METSTTSTYRLWPKIAGRFPFIIRKKHCSIHRYLFACVLMVLALLVRLAIAPVSAGLQYVTFFPAVTLAAIVGGYRAGLFTTIIGLAFATYIFTPPYYSISIEVLQLSFWSNLVFLMDGIIVSFSIEAMHRFRQKYEKEFEEAKVSEGLVMALNRELTEHITKRKQNEEQLRVAAAAFETHDAILITDANANIIRVNHAFTNITGYSPEDVLGKNPRILSSGRQDKAFYAAMWQQLLATGSWTGEMWDRRKSGQIYPKWLTITAVKNEQGETTEYVSIFSDITARKQAEEEIHNLAFYDALTKLPNRRLLLDRFLRARSVSARSNYYGAVLFLDMDRFKTLNDTLGHDHGDLLLIEVAQRIQSCVREVDTVARFGGDEFVVLLEEVDTSAEQASQKVALIAEKIRAVLAAPYQLNDHEYHSSPSIGVCLYRGNTESVDTLLKHADLAMYQAKDSGKNAVRFHDPEKRS
jgi:diguanylate cyclase (GGDEF)-like protein/PAS domain S-box-containing protein